MTTTTLSSSDLLSRLASAADTDTATAQQVLKALASTVSDTLAAGDALTLPGIGILEPRDRAARTGRNPRTGESLEIAATRVPGFKPAAALKRAVAGES